MRTITITDDEFDVDTLLRVIELLTIEAKESERLNRESSSDRVRFWADVVARDLRKLIAKIERITPTASGGYLSDDGDGEVLKLLTDIQPDDVEERR